MRTIVATCLAMLLVPHVTLGATFVVDSSDDEVDAAPGDGMCLSANRRCTLRAAVLEANALAGPDTIVLLAGTYRLVLRGADEDAGFTGDLDITDDLILYGAGEAATIVDGNHIDRVFDVHSPAHLNLSDISIAHGEPAAAEDGGGMSNTGTITLSNVTFDHNNAGRGYGFAGGLDNQGTAVLTHVTFTHNHAGRACPACYYSSSYSAPDPGDIGGMQNTGTATLVSVTFRANHAGDGIRGTYYVDAGNIGAFGNFGSTTLTDVAFLSNRAGDGGGGVPFGADHAGVGGYCGGFYNEGDATLTRVSFTGNRAGDGGSARPYPKFNPPGDGGGGGAVWNYGAIMLSDVTISRNRAGNSGRNDQSAGGGGGGIYNDGEATLNNVTLDRNRAGSSRSPFNQGGSGGAILSYGPMALTNVTITRNRAGNTAGPYHYSDGPGTGGGIAAYGDTTTLTNVTLALNSCGKSSYHGGSPRNPDPDVARSSYGSGYSRPLPCSGNQIDDYYYYSYGIIRLANTIIYGRGQSCPGPMTSLGHNIDSGTTCGLTAAGDLAKTDPRLGKLADNGGFTKTMKLLPRSPAIDAGDNGACPATDQRGVTRPQGSGCDIGAYEAP